MHECIPNDAIRKIQCDCHQIDDDIRRLIASLSDTGMGLTEAAKLLKQESANFDID